MTDPNPSPARHWNTRLGIVLFVIYTIFYLGFVLISALAADMMDTVVLAGLNLAVVYGVALIVLAFVMSVMYGMLCRNDPDDQQSESNQEGVGE